LLWGDDGDSLEFWADSFRSAISAMISGITSGIGFVDAVDEVPSFELGLEDSFLVIDSDGDLRGLKRANDGNPDLLWRAFVCKSGNKALKLGVARSRVNLQPARLVVDDAGVEFIVTGPPTVDLVRLPRSHLASGVKVSIPNPESGFLVECRV
jgi:hypothetical protein